MAPAMKAHTINIPVQHLQELSLSEKSFSKGQESPLVSASYSRPTLEGISKEVGSGSKSLNFGTG